MVISTRISVNSLLEWLLPLSLAATAYAFSLSGGLLIYQMLAFLIFFGLFAFTVVTRPGKWPLKKLNVVVWFVFLIVMAVNLLVNASGYSAVEFREVAMRITGVAIVTFLIQWIAGALDPARLLAALGVALLPLLIYAFGLALVASDGGRLFPLGVHPNWWGELLFCLTIGALATQRRGLRWTMICLAAVLLYFVQARGAMLACASAVTVYYVFRYRSFRIGRSTAMAGLALAAIFLTAAITVIAIYWESGLFGATGFVRDRILFYHDEYRGVGTGLVGRVEGWKVAWEVILEYPLFGVGMDSLVDVHSGYLRLLGEGGVLLAGVVLGVTMAALRAKWRAGNTLGVALIVGYLVLVLTYPRFLNMNLAAVTFYLAVVPWKHATHSNGTPEYRSSPQTGSRAAAI